MPPIVNRLLVLAFALVAFAAPYWIEAPAAYGIAPSLLPWLKLLPGALVLVANVFPNVFRDAPTVTKAPPEMPPHG